MKLYYGSYFSWDHFKSNQYALVVSHHQSKPLPITKPFDVKWSHERYNRHPSSHGTILSKDCVPVIPHLQSKSLPITKSVEENDLKWSHERYSTHLLLMGPF